MILDGFLLDFEGGDPVEKSTNAKRLLTQQIPSGGGEMGGGNLTYTWQSRLKAAIPIQNLLQNRPLKVGSLFG